MNPQPISIRSLIKAFNQSALRNQIIPLGLATGWPAVTRMGETLCITLPYFSSTRTAEGVMLNSIYCSVTVPIFNPDKLMDFTIYPYHNLWQDIPYDRPVGIFPHEALKGLGRKEYHQLCEQLYDYYDQLLEAVTQGKPFGKQTEMMELFSRLMEPALYPQYLRINKKFYSTFAK